MNDLDTLRPEGQEAVTWIDKNQIHPTHKVWGVVRAELLRSGLGFTVVGHNNQI